MNYKAMSQEEASFTLFAFKRVLRDSTQLTPTMVQFYEQSIAVLKEKMLKLELDEKDSRRYKDRVRDRQAQVPPAWPHY